MPNLSSYTGNVKFRDKRGRFAGSGKIRGGRGTFFTGTLVKGMENFERKTSDAIVNASLEFAEKLQEYAQSNAPWEDRTGDARAGLTAEVEADQDLCEIRLSHTVDYGIWLEIRWGGRYAIIIPTIEAVGPEIYDQMHGMCGEIIYYVD